MKTDSQKLLVDLSAMARQHISMAEALQKHPYEELIHRPASGGWNALECLQHLNLYGNFYLPEIEKRIRESKFPPREQFKSGVLGNYFALSMLPKEKLKKMKTFGDKDPMNEDLNAGVISEFIRQQHHMLELLRAAEKVDLSKTRTGISISRLLKLRLGDTFRVVIYHNQRHLEQAQRALSPSGTEAGSAA